MTETEVFIYEEDYLLMTQTVEKVSNRPSCAAKYIKDGKDWEKVLRRCKARSNWFDSYANGPSLSTRYGKITKRMTEVIEIHNKTVRHLNLKERANLTREFLQLPREAPRDEYMQYPDAPLVTGKVFLIYPRGTALEDVDNDEEDDVLANPGVIPKGVRGANDRDADKVDDEAKVVVVADEDYYSDDSKPWVPPRRQESSDEEDPASEEMDADDGGSLDFGSPREPGDDAGWREDEDTEDEEW